MRFAQPRALGRKVSDEFTVPLCRNAYLLTQGTGMGQDTIDVAHGIVPVSLRNDAIHWNNAGHLAVFNGMLAKIQSLGWG